MKDKRLMFYGASPDIFEKARKLRENMTLAERILWNELANKKLEGLRYKSQHPIYRYIADFYCHKAKLVIEVDGGIHLIPENKEYDINREYVMKEFGIDTIRFSNDGVMKEMNVVLKTIERKTNERIIELGLNP